jgi:tetratricopeptide (TPR) repeat protein
LELEPFSLPINATFSCVLMHDRQYDAALDQARKAVEMDPGHPFALEQLGFALLERGDYDEATAALRKSGQSGISRAYARAGRRAEALSALHEGPRQRPSDVALTYAALGENVKAFAWLEKAYSERDPALSDLKVNPRFDILRPEPLFQELLVRMRLD